MLNASLSVLEKAHALGVTHAKSARHNNRTNRKPKDVWGKVKSMHKQDRTEQNSHLVLRKKRCDTKSRRGLVADAVGDLQHKHVTPTAVVDAAVVSVSDRTDEKKLKQHRVGARRDDVSDVDVDNVVLERR